MDFARNFLYGSYDSSTAAFDTGLGIGLASVSIEQTGLRCETVVFFSFFLFCFSSSFASEMISCHDRLGTRVRKPLLKTRLFCTHSAVVNVDLELNDDLKTACAGANCMLLYDPDLAIGTKKGKNDSLLKAIWVFLV